VKLDEAHNIALLVVSLLRESCKYIAIAGSIRRQKPEVKDIEIVFVPLLVERAVSLFDTKFVPLTDEVIDNLIFQNILAWDTQVKRRGPRYKRLVHVTSGLVVEFFQAVPETWGLQLALRTGPADFNRLLVSHEWNGGAMPVGMKMAGGWLWRSGKRLETPTEAIFFAEIGVPCWPPQERTEARLRGWLENRNG